MGVTRKKGLTSKTRKPGNQVTRKGPFSGWASEYTALGAPGDGLRGHWTQCPANVSCVQKAALAARGRAVRGGGDCRRRISGEQRKRVETKRAGGGLGFLSCVTRAGGGLCDGCLPSAPPEPTCSPLHPAGACQSVGHCGGSLVDLSYCWRPARAWAARSEGGQRFAPLSLLTLDCVWFCSPLVATGCLSPSCSRFWLLLPSLRLQGPGTVSDSSCFCFLVLHGLP